MTTLPGPERLKELRGVLVSAKGGCENLLAQAQHDLDRKILQDGIDQWSDLLAILDALPGLQAEVERWKEKYLDACEKIAGHIDDKLELKAGLEAARPLIEELVDYVREHLANHTFALGETTPKNKAKAADMRRVIKKAEAEVERAKNENALFAENYNLRAKLEAARPLLEAVEKADGRDLEQMGSDAYEVLYAALAHLKALADLPNKEGA
jgi:glutathione S-transferase